jgi:hypothetical protein
MSLGRAVALYRNELTEVYRNELTKGGIVILQGG